MPQGKLKAKAKVPASVAKKKAKAAKGPGISRKSKFHFLFRYIAGLQWSEAIMIIQTDRPRLNPQLEN